MSDNLSDMPKAFLVKKQKEKAGHELDAGIDAAELTGELGK